MSKNFSLTRSRMWRTRAATALAAVGALVMGSGLVMLSASTATAEPPEGAGPDPKVVVCKYVGIPGGELHHIVIVSENTLNNTPYVAPPNGDSWTDAHGQTTEGSIAIRYAAENEQAHDVPLSSCPGSTQDACPTLGGTQAQGFECTKAPTTRDVVQVQDSCTLQGPNGLVGGTRTVTLRYTTTYAFDVVNQVWVGTESGPVTLSDVFTPYTAQQRTQNECDEVLGTEEIAPAVSFADPTCARPNRTTWSGNLTDLVNYSVSRAPARGRTITVTASIKSALADQFAFPAGFDNTFTHTYPTLTELNCVLGEETVIPSPKPKPQPKPPVVLGTQAVAPTAVHAGLADMPGTTSSTSSLLAQLMVGGGLLLLLAGGWLGFGRREYGVHQA